MSNPKEEEPLDGPSVGSNNQDMVVGDMFDEGWTKLHSDEVQEMLDFEVEGKQYKIQRHYFTKGKVELVVNDRISETLAPIDVVDYKCDFPHVLATNICSKNFH